MPRTEHEHFWASDASDVGRALTASESATKESQRLLERMMGLTRGVRSAIDVGFGNGRHLVMLRDLYPEMSLAGMEIHVQSQRSLVGMIPPVPVYGGSILRREVPGGPYDLVMAMGLLACVPEGEIEVAYQRLYDVARKYILIRDYGPSDLSKVFEEVEYSTSTVFRRSYAERLPELYPDLTVVTVDVEEGTGDPPLQWTLLQRRAPARASRRSRSQGDVAPTTHPPRQPP